MGGVVNRNKTSLVLVTGATGAVGPRVVKALSDSGHQIRTVSLDSPPTGIWPKAIETQIGDITNPAVVQSAMRGVDAVVHLAALLHIVNPTPDLRHKYEKINVGGTAMVVEAAVRANVSRVVLFSTIAVYGDSSGQVFDEESHPNPKTFYEQTKLDAERIVLGAKKSPGQPIGTVLRLAAVYGSRIKGNYRQLLKALAKSRFIPIGNGRNRRTLVYEKDVARAAVLAVEHPDAAGKVFNVSDGTFHSMNDIIASMCKALDRKAPRFSLPVGPVRFVAGMVEDVARIVGHKPPIMRTMIDKYTEDTAVDSRRIQKMLAFVPGFDLATAWKETVQEMRLSGEL
jgi:nucleoside-diphosphate-sugar epimerase